MSNNPLGKIIANAKANMNKSDTDYIDELDGLLHCGACGEPRQMKLELCGQKTVVPIVCRCIKKKREREQRQRDEREKADRIENIRRKGISSPRYMQYRFENDRFPSSKPSRAARRYIEQWDSMRENNRGLMLLGAPGTGKTFLACCIANALIDNAVPAFITNVSDITKIGGTDEERTRITELTKTAPLMVIDDIGVERGTQYATERLYSVIDLRYRTNLPLIVTTNLSADELKIGDIDKMRIYDRLAEMCPFQIKIERQSLRQTNE